MLRCLVVALAVFLFPRHVRADAPTWCGEYKSAGDSNAKWVDGYLKSEGWTFRVLEKIAKGACDAPADAKRQADVASWRDAWCARNGCAGNDFADVMALAIDPPAAEKLAKEQCSALQLKTPEELAIAAVLGCVRGVDKGDQWSLDRPEISEMLRTAWVATCLHTAEAGVVPAAMGRDTLAIWYLECGPDLKRMDRAKLDKELANAKYNAYGRAKARTVFGTTKLLADAVGAELPAAAQKVFAAAEAGDKAWRASYAAHKAALDLAWDLDTVKGHGAELRKAFDEYVAAGKPKTFDDAMALATDAVGLPLLVALSRAEVDEGDALAATAHAEIVAKATRARRGPRTAAYWAALDAFSEVKAELPISAFSGLAAPRYVAREPGTPSQGVIAGIKGGTVTFKQESWKQPLLKCTETDKIERIEANGQVVYRQNCVPGGERTVTHLEKPVEVPDSFARGLAAGQLARFTVVADQEGHRRGIPIEVYSDKARKKLVVFLGVNL